MTTDHANVGGGRLLHGWTNSLQCWQTEWKSFFTVYIHVQCQRYPTFRLNAKPNPIYVGCMKRLVNPAMIPTRFTVHYALLRWEQHVKFPVLYGLADWKKQTGSAYSSSSVSLCIVIHVGPGWGWTFVVLFVTHKRARQFCSNSSKVCDRDEQMLDICLCMG